MILLTEMGLEVHYAHWCNARKPQQIVSLRVALRVVIAPGMREQATIIPLEGIL